MKQLKQTKLSVVVALAMLGTLYGCGSADTPDPNNIPDRAEVNTFTSADIGGRAVKGTLANADITVSQFNGADISVTSNGLTDADGAANFAVQGAAGFGLNGMVKVQVVANSGTTMTCDAPTCGTASMGDMVTGEALAGTTLSSYTFLSVPYASTSDSNEDATFQASALTTVATSLVDAAGAAGRNLSVTELFLIAMEDFSDTVLKGLGVFAPGTNVFEASLISAESYDNFVVGQDCQTTDEMEVCTDVLADPSTIKASLVNAAFANLADGENYNDVITFATTSIQAALDGDLLALDPLRERMLASVQNVPFLEQLGMSAEDVVDLGLAFIEEDAIGGPTKEITTTENVATATITARNRISDAEAEDKAFDGSDQTKWLDHNDFGPAPSVEDPSWIQIEFSEPQAVNTVFITSANDAPERDIENFNMTGSLDGETFVSLGEFVGITFDERFQRQKFKFQNGLSFPIYRLNITKNKGDAGLTQVAEFDYLGPIFSDIDQSDVSDKTIVARAFISEGENQDKVFDNDSSTKWLDNGGIPSEDDPAWVEVSFIEAVAINTLAVTSANDAPERDPENFDLQARNSADDAWVEIGRVVGESFDERFQRKSFNFQNQLAFNIYRFNVTKNSGNSDLMQIAEIEMIGPQVPGLNHGMSEGATYVARAFISDGENQDKAFDGDANTKWLDNGGIPSAEDPAWVRVDLPVAKTVNALLLTSANDAPERDPENFNVWGSNDAGTTWIELGNWVGETFENRFQQRLFSFSNLLPFTSYRFNVTKNAGNSDLMQIAEVGFVGPQYDGVDHSGTSGAVYTARAFISDGENQDKVFDDSADTKWLDNASVPSEDDPAWVQVDLPEGKIVTALAITSANDAPERDPENFSVVGSNDGGVTWEVIGSWIGETFDNRFERKLFDMDNGFAYSTYRLNISKNKGDSNLMQIAEIELIGLQID